ncbi:B12-binding domain-containing radical SAM protein [candidate division CSSED10-310 bacterium]|uniref:B12-binding domain-containing radical SAM protein n=1 Tax=candidate division CSSED10-310 bacterium TaxID=2855610 RepID=A0ABV6YTY3_UNCC1
MKPPHIVLIHPWIEDFAAFDFWIRPLGLLRLATYLKWQGFKVTLIDCLERTSPDMKALIKTQKGKDSGDGRGNFYKLPLPKPAAVSFIPRRFSRYGISVELFEQYLRDTEGPDLICLTSGMTYWYPALETVQRHIHDRWPHVPQVIGGIYASLLPEHAASKLAVKRVFPGLLSADFHQFLRELFPKFLISSTSSVDLMKFILEPDYSLLTNREYVSIETSQGCPYRCSYCATSIHSAHFVQFSPVDVLKLLNMLVNGCGTRDIAFYDDALFYNPATHIKPILQAVLKQNFRVRFHTPNGLFPRFIDLELADLMVKTGFRTIRLSLDTMSAERQKEMRKLEPSHLATAFHNLSAAGFPRKNIEVYLLVGLPGQKEEEVRAGLEFVAQLGGITRLAQFSPVPGTLEWQKAIELGIIKADSDPLLQNPSVYAFLNPTLTYEHFLQLKNLTAQLNHEIRG